MSTRIAYFDNAKFLLILLVVIGHAADFVVDDSRAMQALFVFIYSFHMPAFIFIAGLFAHGAVSGKLDIARVFSFISLGFFLKALIFVAQTPTTPSQFSICCKI